MISFDMKPGYVVKSKNEGEAVGANAPKEVKVESKHTGIDLFNTAQELVKQQGVANDQSTKLKDLGFLKFNFSYGNPSSAGVG